LLTVDTLLAIHYPSFSKALRQSSLLSGVSCRSSAGQNGFDVAATAVGLCESSFLLFDLLCRVPYRVLEYPTDTGSSY